MIESICAFAVYLFSPVVRKVIRKSLMGNYFDKTLEYYIGTMKMSVMDDHHSIEFSYKNQNYIVVCEEEDTYRHTLSYIGRTDFEDNENSEIIAAFEEEGGVYKNITDLVKKFHGPEKNFYSNTAFPVKKSHISDNVIYIIDDTLKIYKFDDDNAGLTMDVASPIDLKGIFY